MKNQVMEHVLQQVADLHGVDQNTVSAGIQEAMEAARRTEDADSGVFWQMMPEDATVLDLILGMTHLLCAE
ncbi:MAG: hypothetical protein IJF56_08985 [Clostridia bacterium]|nr:hypothetical protein [Clostridia bacterium]